MGLELLLPDLPVAGGSCWSFFPRLWQTGEEPGLYFPNYGFLSVAFPEKCFLINLAQRFWRRIDSEG